MYFIEALHRRMNWIHVSRINKSITCSINCSQFSLIYSRRELSILGIALPSRMPQMSGVSTIERQEGTIALTGAARASVGPIPRKKVPNPSARYDCTAQSNALEYFRPAPMISVCSRDLITSIVSGSFEIEYPLDKLTATSLRRIYVLSETFAD